MKKIYVHRNNVYSSFHAEKKWCESEDQTNVQDQTKVHAITFNVSYGM